jgi:hypothetical protein
MQWMCTREEHQEPVSEEGQQDRRSPRTHSDVCGPMPSSSINGLRYSGQIMEENILQRIREYLQRCWDQDLQQNGVAERKNRTMLEAVKIKIFLRAYG